MDIKGTPVELGTILAGRHRNNPNGRMFLQNGVADVGPLSGLIQRNHDQVGQSQGHPILNFGLLGNFADDFNARLICKCGENGFPHEFRLVGNEDTNHFAHSFCLTRSQVSGFQRKREGSKTNRCGTDHGTRVGGLTIGHSLRPVLGPPGSKKFKKSIFAA
jgi:hypothetical protein